MKEGENIKVSSDFEQIVMESKSMIYFCMEPSGKVSFYNNGYKEILAYEEEQIIEKFIAPTWKDITRKLGDDLVFEGYITFYKNGPNVSYYSKVYRRQNQLIFLCEYNGFEVENLYMQMENNTREILNMNRELIKTQLELKTTLKELHNTQARLIHAERMNALGHLVAGIAHEINNPLGYVAGNLQMIEEYIKNIKEYISEIELEAKQKKQMEDKEIPYIIKELTPLVEESLRGTARIAKIVSGLRDFSRIDTSDISYTTVEQCVKEALIIAKPQMSEKEIKLQLLLEPTTKIECYAAQLNQCFLNFIVNAIQACKQNGYIEIKVYEGEKNVYMEIMDNGIGIEQKNIEHIYDAFYTTKVPGEGVGLGLNIAHRIIGDVHGGNIEVISQVDKMTKFTISLPKMHKVT